MLECFLKQNALLLVPGGFIDLINQKNLDSNWKNNLNLENLKEKLEKQISTNFQEKIQANQLTMEKKS